MCFRIRGNPVATKCAANGQPYIVSGCSKIPSCIRSTTTTGYDYSDVNENLQMHTFSVTGLKCVYWYEGNPVVTNCTADGQPYSVSGCTQNNEGSTCYRVGYMLQ